MPTVKHHDRESQCHLKQHDMTIMVHFKGVLASQPNSAKHPEVKTTYPNVGDNNQKIETFLISDKLPLIQTIIESWITEIKHRVPTAWGQKLLRRSS